MNATDWDVYACLIYRLCYYSFWIKFFKFLENADLYLPTSLNPSNSQYLVCTRTKHTGIEEATPVLGFGLLQEPCPVLIALLHTGVVVDLSVVDLHYLPRIDPPEPVVSPSKKVNESLDNYNDLNIIFLPGDSYLLTIFVNLKITREPFDTYIRNLLKHDSTSQPITKLGIRSKLSAKECLEVNITFEIVNSK